MIKQVIFLIISILLLVACSKKSNDTTTPISNPGGIYTYASFPFGASINLNLLRNNAVYAALVTKEYNSITPENAMKFASVQPAAATFDFTDADYLVNYAQQNGKRIHGHTLVWYQSLPGWVTNFQGDSVAWEQLLKNHIQTEVAHFKGKLASWDVVNEAFEDDGTLRKSVWEQHLGTDYIARCFVYAHESDPAAVLFYNDYGSEYSTLKRQAIINLANSLKKRGIPIGGIGLQMHTSSNTSDDDNVAAITATASGTGLKIHVSELDISMNPNNIQTLTYTQAIANAQAQKYFAIVSAYKALPASQQWGITTWDVSDADSWIPVTYKRPDWPLPFDNNYQPKAAYQSILNALK